MSRKRREAIWNRKRTYCLSPVDSEFRSSKRMMSRSFLHTLLPLPIRRAFRDSAWPVRHQLNRTRPLWRSRFGGVSVARLLVMIRRRQVD